MLLIDGLKGIWPWSWLFAPTSPRVSSAATLLQAPHTAGSGTVRPTPGERLLKLALQIARVAGW